METTSVATLQISESILDCIGNTPLVRLRRFSESVGRTVLAKLEGANPGLSAKDRIAVSMVDALEEQGKLCIGGTIIETTSGNTGLALAMVAAVRGYRCILVTNDKISTAKHDALKALGAAVEICPSNVDSRDPRSYYERAKTLQREIPGSVYINQYFHPGNPTAHFESTGPELWRQTDGLLTHYVAPVGYWGLYLRRKPLFEIQKSAHSGDRNRRLRLGAHEVFRDRCL